MIIIHSGQHSDPYLKFLITEKERRLLPRKLVVHKESSFLIYNLFLGKPERKIPRGCTEMFNAVYLWNRYMEKLLSILIL